MIQITKERKVCDNCNVNAMFSYEEVDLVGYGTRTAGSDMICQNCGHIQND